MKKYVLSLLLVLVLILSVCSVSALTASDAKKDWLDKKKLSASAQTKHKDAKLEFVLNKSEDNKQEVIDTGKTLLTAALDEAESWLKWKKADAEENTEVPDSLKNAVIADVDKNLAKIDPLRDDVKKVKTQLELGLVTLKMIGKYFELVSDVARNAGNVWVYIGNNLITKASDYESKLRTAALTLDDNADILTLLDNAKKELDTAKTNVAKAKDTYALVKMPGTPLIKFGEANNYLKAGKANLMLAYGHLNQAFVKITVAGGVQNE